MAPRHILTCGLLALTSAVAFAQQQGLRLMSWNVENLFDVEHDEGFHDEEFLPTGSHRWTRGRYWQKMNDITRVVAAVAEDGGLPDLIGLCEVENDSVLTTLTHRSPMRRLGYEYVMTNSPDRRGVDVALLYQPERFHLLEHYGVRIHSAEKKLPPTRDILYAKGLIRVEGIHRMAGVDTLHVLVVHLPSRTSGRRGDRNRQLAAQTLWGVVDSIGLEKHIVVMGDFNATARDRIFRQSPLRITDNPQVPGTYCFRGRWQWIDHILLSPSVMTDSPASVPSMPWLLEEDSRYGAQKPRRTYLGPTYLGGISDHLAILLQISLSHAAASTAGEATSSAE